MHITHTEAIVTKTKITLCPYKSVILVDVKSNFIDWIYNTENAIQSEHLHVHQMA